MNRFQQNLLIVLALALCGLCVYQWYDQTQQRTEIEGLTRTLYRKAEAIQGYTNSIATMDRQIAQMDARLTALKEETKTNAAVVARQQRDLNHLETTSAGLTNEIVASKKAVETLEKKLKEAYDGIEKQNAALKELAAQRDEFITKYNNSVKDRNDVVSKYNDLVAQVQKAQSTK
jgi:chromosome segregation ATPase